tara:strand:+ start:70 stop:495 length:426 start_codon:yes stop_codon:yes gene_type:complete
VHDLEIIDRLSAATLQSNRITNSRLKLLSAMAQSSEDHISRLGMGLSMADGPVHFDWTPTALPSENDQTDGDASKHIRGRTLFKEELPIWMALALRHQNPVDYGEWRNLLRVHWERGVEILAQIAAKEDDWIRVLNEAIPE